MSTRKDFIKKTINGSLGLLTASQLSSALWGGVKGVGEDDPVIPGEIDIPYPTFHNLAVEWFIEGDEALTSMVTVHFRERGSRQWRVGMPLRRVPAGKNVGFQWQNKHSGSIFNLKAGTEYEIKLTLKDQGKKLSEKKVQARTRSLPTVGRNAEVIEISPGRHKTLETKDGSEEKPVVYQCSSGKAVFEHIDLTNREWVYIKGLDVRNRDEEGIGITLTGAEQCCIQHCHIASCYGIVAYKPGATNCYVSDNIVTGINEWKSKAMGASGENIGEGIQMTGPGNVIAYNEVSGFRDCISTMEDRHAANQTCIDIHNNDVYKAVDDAIEADFCISNCRIYTNRLTNVFVGLSSQPGLGGPTYFIRNVMYNIPHKAFKLSRYSQGDVVLHNTAVKVGAGLGGNSPMDHAYFRNNLAIGGPNGERKWGGYGPGKPYAADIIEPGRHSSFDYDAVGVYGTPYVAKIGGKPFGEVEEHGIEEITMEETFENVPFPDPPVPVWEVPDLRPKATSRVVDAGVRIPNINDGFRSSAPDIGAYEAGQELPHYGPRPAGEQH